LLRIASRAVCLVGALLVAGVASSEPREEDASAAGPDAELDPGVPREEIPAAPPPGPLAVFAAVEKAWADEDVEALVAHLDPEERVRIAMATAGPRGGWFNRDQAYFLIKDMFAFSETERFEFERFWNLDSRGRSPYAVAVRKLGDEAGARTDRVYISLRKRGDAWYIGEIRSIDR
jgi:hypothetical protein